MKLPQITATGVLALVGLAVGGFVAWKLYRAASAAGSAISDAAAAAADVAMHTITTDLNPASEENIINRTFLALPRYVTGDPNWSLGGWVYDYLHPNAFTQNSDAKPSGAGLTAAEQMGFPL